MGFRFQKSIRIAPGIRLNLSKGGISASLGRPGATINVGKRGVRGTVGVPGSGLSYSEMLVKRPRRQASDGSDAPPFEAQSGKRVLLFIGIGLAALLVAGLLAGRWNVTEAHHDKGVSPAVSSVASDDSPTAGSVVTMATVNCRSAPNKQANLIDTLAPDTSVAVVATDGKWSRIRQCSTECWVSSDYLG